MARRLGRDWSAILVAAKTIIEQYDTPVTLRQLFYRLVAAQVLRNLPNDYQALSRFTAEARRTDGFPSLLDQTREIYRYETFTSPQVALRWLSEIYRRDRTEGQAVALYLGVEKHGLVQQLRTWFGDLGVPIVALGGYPSQTYVDDIVADVQVQSRPAALLYAGDFDPSGEDIVRDFTARVGCFADVQRVALSADQIEQYDLPPQPGKATDSRAAGFVARHGALVQVELDALPPEVLRALFEGAIAEYWDGATYHAVLAREKAERVSVQRRAC